MRQVTPDGAVLASTAGSPAGFRPFGVAVVEYTDGLPATLAVSDYDKNSIHFFQRTL